MIGILLALQVNNWSETNKLKIAEKEFIEGVKTDLEEDQRSIKSTIVNIIKLNTRCFIEF